ncbi:hypothetical protein ACI2LC_28350 [Nonomuraea wenchangensis]|uniref:hypothetical protein n=1 Tax=Nonomuraea wenchangensis TaxID=568860 RepID=UPI003319B82E
MTIPVILEDLQAAFPGWCIWRSSAGRLWATRNGRRLSRHEVDHGLSQTIDADDVAQLAEQLKGQRTAEEALSSPPQRDNGHMRKGATLVGDTLLDQ